MADIAQIQSFVQEFAETIAQVLEVDVTIVDENSVRIGGTGPYRAKVGQVVPHGSLFRRILETGEQGELGVTRDEDRHETCRTCAAAGECLELATLGFPVVKDGKPVGIICIMAFTPEQKERIITSAAKLRDFLIHMSNLLAGKLLLIEANQRLRHQVREAMEAVNRHCSFDTMIGRSPAFQQVVGEALRIAQGMSTVLIRGETGTGKELLARAIHAASGRNAHPFIVVNCPSIPETLLESELFGYEGGAFTGASRGGKPGKFELAREGTIFLDEIGDLSPALQPKLLRAIQERTVERVGGRQAIPVDVRVIAATNRDLEDMVRQGSFRADLYYRLNVIPLFLPPLRERREDIELFWRHFLDKYARRLGKEIRETDPALLRRLRDHNWPGNIRELENVAEYVAVMAQTDRITLAGLPRNLPGQEDLPACPGSTLEERLAAYEKSVLAGCLREGSSLADKKRVAGELGISLATLYRKLEKYRLQ